MSDDSINPTPDETLQAIQGPMFYALEGQKITREYLAKKLKKELNATTVRHIVHEGKVVERVRVPDMTIRQRARQDAHKLLAHYPAETLRIGTLEEQLSRMSDEELDARISALERESSKSGLPGGEG